VAVRRYLSEDHDRWDGFEHRPGDIVVSTRSKCGTTLAQMMCALVVFQDPDLPAPLAEISPWLDWSVEPLEVVRQRLDSQQHRRIIKTHTPLDGLPIDPRVTYLVVGRHPLDVAVSLYHHGRNIDRNVVTRLGGSEPLTDHSLPLEEWLRGWMDPVTAVEEQLDTLPGLVHHVSDAWQRSADNSNVTLLHYRNLTDDARGQLRNLARLLQVNIPESRLKRLARAASFEAMKARAAWHVPDHLGVLKDPDAFFRAGRHGEGERALKEQDRRRYEHRIRGLAAPVIREWLHQGSVPNR
jgi:aryl sulfotransferase